MSYENCIFQFVSKIFCVDFKVSFEIPRKIYYPYIERYEFYSQVKI